MHMAIPMHMEEEEEGEEGRRIFLFE